MGGCREFELDMGWSRESLCDSVTYVIKNLLR